MSRIKVKNLNGSSRTPTCTEGVCWIDLLVNFRNYTRGICARKGSCNIVDVCGHVKKVLSQDETDYIIPLRKKYDNLSSDTEYEIEEKLLVSVSHNNWPNGKSCLKR